MPRNWYERLDGSFDNFRLPRSARKTLRQANITALEQLKAYACQLEQCEGISPKTALIIREEILCLTSHK
jgi:hypothetical protein